MFIATCSGVGAQIQCTRHRSAHYLRDSVHQCIYVCLFVCVCACVCVCVCNHKFERKRNMCCSWSTTQTAATLHNIFAMRTSMQTYTPSPHAHATFNKCSTWLSWMLPFPSAFERPARLTEIFSLLDEKQAQEYLWAAGLKPRASLFTLTVQCWDKSIHIVALSRITMACQLKQCVSFIPSAASEKSEKKGENRKENTCLFNRNTQIFIYFCVYKYANIPTHAHRHSSAFSNQFPDWKAG